MNTLDQEFNGSRIQIQRERVSTTAFPITSVWSQVPDMDAATWVHKKAGD